MIFVSKNFDFFKTVKSYIFSSDFRNDIRYCTGYFCQIVNNQNRCVRLDYMKCSVFACSKGQSIKIKKKKSVCAKLSQRIDHHYYVIALSKSCGCVLAFKRKKLRGKNRVFYTSTTIKEAY